MSDQPWYEQIASEVIEPRLLALREVGSPSSGDIVGATPDGLAWRVTPGDTPRHNEGYLTEVRTALVVRDHINSAWERLADVTLQRYGADMPKLFARKLAHMLLQPEFDRVSKKLEEALKDALDRRVAALVMRGSL